MTKLHKALALARHPSTPPGEAQAAWIRAAALAAKHGVSLDVIWTHDGKQLHEAGLWPQVVDAWHDAAEQAA